MGLQVGLHKSGTDNRSIATGLSDDAKRSTVERCTLTKSIRWKLSSKFNSGIPCQIPKDDVHQWVPTYFSLRSHKNLKLNLYSGGWRSIGSTRHCGHQWPIVPAPGDYDDGGIGGSMTGKRNRSTRRKPAPVPLCPPQTPDTRPDANPSRRSGKPATNRLSYGTACTVTQSFHLSKTLVTCEVGRINSTHS
jgi:hypothetical protein